MSFIRLLLYGLLMCPGADFTYIKPRRVFTRGCVAFCVLVAVLERVVRNDLYKK